MNLKSRFDLVIFDWAGTMVDFGCEAPVKALIEAFGAEGVVIDAAAARRDMGKAKIDHVRSAAGSSPRSRRPGAAGHGRAATAEDIDLLMARLGPLMREHAARASTLIPGARQTFEALRRRRSSGRLLDRIYARNDATGAGAGRRAGLRAGTCRVFRRDAGGPALAADDLQGVRRAGRVAVIAGGQGRRRGGGHRRGQRRRRVHGGGCIGQCARPVARGIAGAAPVRARAAAWKARQHALLGAGADLVIDSVADLVPALERAAQEATRPAA